MSTPTNNIKLEKERVAQVPINPATSFNSGDMMKWDAVNHVATPTVAGDAGSATAAGNFIGVSNDTNPITSLKQNLSPPRIAIVTRALVQFIIGDSANYFPGDLVTIGTDPQTVTKSNASAANAIGAVAAENSFSVVAGVTQPIVGVPGLPILVYLKPQFSNLSTM